MMTMPHALPLQRALTAGWVRCTGPLAATLAATLATTLLTTAPAPAWAETKVYTTVLSGAAEAPPNASPGTGSATVTLDLTALTLRLEASFSDLLQPLTVAHIHCCTALAGSGTAGVATVTPTFTDFPTATSGSYDRVFDMSVVGGSFNPAFVTANGGTAASAFAALASGIDSGKAYLNLHSSAVPSGEIRGFLAPIPEPSTYALMAVGLAGLAWARRQRQG